MIYKNKSTGYIINTQCEIVSDVWERLDKIEAPISSTIEDDKPKKPKRTRKKVAE